MSLMKKLFAQQTSDRKQGYKNAILGKKLLIMAILLSGLLVSSVFGMETSKALNHDFYVLLGQNFAQDSLSAVANWQPTFSVKHKPNLPTF